MDGLYLIGQGWSSAQIASWLNYKHACHFWRDFKRAHGVTPGVAGHLGPVPRPTDALRGASGAFKDIQGCSKILKGIQSKMCPWCATGAHRMSRRG
jgi:AraC-like DNA-binding protein